MKRRRVTRIAALVLMAAVFSSNGFIPQNSAEAGTVKTQKVSMIKGHKKKLKASKLSGAVKWKTSDKKTVKVSKTGKITAVKKGKATVTASAGSKKQKFKITVYSPKLKKRRISLNEGEKEKLKISGAGKNKATWSSSDTSVAAVSAQGVVTGKKAGRAVITGKVLGKKFKCNVSVLHELEATPLPDPGRSFAHEDEPETSIEIETTAEPTTAVISETELETPKSAKYTYNVTIVNPYDVYYTEAPIVFFIKTDNPSGTTYEDENEIFVHTKDDINDEDDYFCKISDSVIFADMPVIENRLSGGVNKTNGGYYFVLKYSKTGEKQVNIYEKSVKVASISLNISRTREEGNDEFIKDILANTSNGITADSSEDERNKAVQRAAKYIQNTCTYLIDHDDVNDVNIILAADYGIFFQSRKFDCWTAASIMEDISKKYGFSDAHIYNPYGSHRDCRYTLSDGTVVCAEATPPVKHLTSWKMINE